MKNVSFITTEKGDDLIVSFAISGSSFSDVKSLTLLRTPKYDFILDDSERGVRVSYDDFPDDDDDLLVAIEIKGQRVTIRTRHRDYDLSLRGVDPKEIEEAATILKKMNVDDRFFLQIVMAPKCSKLHSDRADDPQDLVQRLWELEDDFPQALREDCLAAGAALVPELIHRLEAELDTDALGWPSLYAVELLGTLGDGRAAPILLRCLEQSDAFELLYHEASQALVKLGAPAMERCLAAYAESDDDAFRDEIAAVLEHFETRDERIYAIFLETLERTPELGANLLAAYGDPRAVPALVQLFDDLPVQHEDSPLANRVFIELRCAIEDLGGALTAAQEAKFEQSDAQRRRFVARMDNVLSGPSASWQRGSTSAASAASPRRPVVRTQPKLGRNAPCWCGSGKKYKKCHLRMDEG